MVSWSLSLSKEGIWASVSLLVRCRVSPALPPSQGFCGNQAELERSRVCIEDVCLPRWPGIQILFLFGGQGEGKLCLPIRKGGGLGTMCMGTSPCSANPVSSPNTGIVEEWCPEVGADQNVSWWPWGQQAEVAPGLATVCSTPIPGFLGFSLLLSLLLPVFFCCLNYLQPASVIFSDESWPVESTVSCLPVRPSPCVVWPSGFSLGGAEKHRCLNPALEIVKQQVVGEFWVRWFFKLEKSQSRSCLFICPRHKKAMS